VEASVELHHKVAAEARWFPVACIQPVHRVDHGNFIVFFINLDRAFAFYGIALNQEPRFSAVLEEKAHQARSGCPSHLCVDRVVGEADGIFVRGCDLALPTEGGGSLAGPEL
jgi:hypothetical protein